MRKKQQVKTQNAVGRPKALVEDEETLNKIKMLAAGQHTQVEAAALLGVSLACLEKFLRSSTKARELWDEGRGHGLGSLRRMQFVQAQKGSVPMQIWLGKQYLGQKDKSDVSQTHEMGESLKQLWTLLGQKRAEASNG